MIFHLISEWLVVIQDKYQFETKTVFNNRK